jgi:hypothetical protein
MASPDGVWATVDHSERGRVRLIESVSVGDFAKHIEAHATGTNVIYSRIYNRISDGLKEIRIRARSKDAFRAGSASRASNQIFVQGAGSKINISPYGQVMSGSLSIVSYFDARGRGIWRMPIARNVLNADDVHISSELLLGRFLSYGNGRFGSGGGSGGGFDSVKVGAQRLPDEPNPGPCYYHPDPSSYCRIFGPIRRLPLGLKIALGAPLIAVGFWIAWRGLAGDDWRDTSLHHLPRGVLVLLGGGRLIVLGGFLPIL